MTIQDVIDRADAIAPNQYTDTQKLQWLSDFDGKVFHEVYMTHEPRFAAMYPFEGYDAAGDELLIEAPYAADVYVNYLLSRVAEANAEIPKYNLYATLMNTAYDQFTAWYNRTHMPADKGRWRF